VDLEVQNTTAGVGNAATVQLRQTTANTTANSTLANINFGDATVTTPQAQINVTRDAASSGSTDLPTRMTFSTTPDGSATLTERMRIDNVGQVTVNNLAGTGSRPVYADNNGVLRVSNNGTFTAGTYTTTGSTTFNVPTGVYQIFVYIIGAGGGASYYSVSTNVGGGGTGGCVYGIIDVTPGETLTIFVGTGGSGTCTNNNGGGGGTGSYIARSSTVLAGAGGGGGGSYCGNVCGAGNGGGYSLGTTTTSLNAANGIGSGSTTYNAAGGNNCISYLRNPVSIIGYGGSNTYDPEYPPFAVTGMTYYSGSVGSGGQGSYCNKVGGNGYVYIRY
jgi:hypothetical protein